MMKRLLITLTAAVLVASSLWGKDDEVIVTRQLTMGQRNSLPEKTITVEMKRLAFDKKADAGLIDAITQIMDTIASEDYQNHTFVLLLEPKADGEVSIGVRSDDIVTRGKQNATIYFGTLEHGRCHFVVLTGKDNMVLLESTFKRQRKVKFVQEFEFVEFKTPNYPTNVIGRWTPDKGLKLITVIINEDPNADRDSFDDPARMQE
jgi:hypothetical protein